LVNGKLPQPIGFFDLGFSSEFDDHWMVFLSVRWIFNVLLLIW
jgi:long-subunit fatty acid transport protein